MRKWPWQQVAKPIELDTDLEACFGRDFLILLKENGFIGQRLVSCILSDRIDWECVAKNLRVIGEHYNSRYYYWYVFNLNLKYAPQFMPNQ